MSVKFHLDENWLQNKMLIDVGGFDTFFFFTIKWSGTVQSMPYSVRIKNLKLDTLWKNFLFNLRDICNSKNKGELVECRLCLEDTICHASLFHELYWLWTIWLFSLALYRCWTIHSVARKSSIVFATQGYWISHCSPAFGFVKNK